MKQSTLLNRLKKYPAVEAGYFTFLFSVISNYFLTCSSFIYSPFVIFFSLSMMNLLLEDVIEVFKNLNKNTCQHRDHRNISDY